MKHGQVYDKGPDLRCPFPATRIVFVRINAAHRYHNTDSSEEIDLMALCPRCHARDDIQAKWDYSMNHAGEHQVKLFWIDKPHGRFVWPRGLLATRRPGCTN